MNVYHCTTPKKLDRYRKTGAILSPVRYWVSEQGARKWMKKTGRTILITFTEPERSWPLPGPNGLARWSDQLIREFEEVNQ